MPGIRPHPITGRYEDAAHRIADDINTVLVNEGFDIAGEWMIFGLDDGKPAVDNASHKHQHYPTKEMAVYFWRSMRPAILCMIPPDGAKPRDVANWLHINRQAWENGYRLTNGIYDPQPIPHKPLNLEDLK
jgi:hypothetical protein